MKSRRSDQLSAKLSFLSIMSLTASLVLLNLGSIAGDTSHAQVTQTPGASGLNTQVNQVGNVYEITGGTTAGSNLFHSFETFSVGTVETARFQTINLVPDVTVDNVLGRVTGGTPSNILGAINSATYYPNANLFLMNPAGFLFGPGATVNVGGMVAFTSANYMKLADTARFNAAPNTAADALLTALPVASFGFLGAKPGAITVQGSQFTVTEGTGISLVAGNITVEGGTPEGGALQPAHLSAPGGQINLASVASAGEVLVQNLLPEAGMTMGTITLAQGSTLDASADAAGTVKIRGGQFVIADGTLSADTGNTNGAPIAIDINVTGDLSITDTRGVPAMTARTMGTGDSGEIQLTSGNLVATSSFDPSSLPTFTSTLIDSHASGDGRGGDVHITTGNLTVAGPNNNAFYFIDSGTVGNGRGGNISIQANIADINWASISTGQFNVSALLEDTSGVNGSAGNLTIEANTLQLKNSILNTSAFFGLSELQRGGDIIINVHDISMMNTQIGSTGLDGGGAFVITGDRLVTDFTFLETDTVSGPGGGIRVNARAVDLTNGSALISSTFGDGNAGDIYVTATDHVNLIGRTGPNPLGSFQPSGLFSNSFGELGSQGSAGNVVVTTPRLEMIGGRINTVTASSGHGGNVTLNVPDVISISGEFLTDPSIVPSIFHIGPLAPSGIVTQTIGNVSCSGPCGNAGNVSITTGALIMGSGAQIDAGTSGTRPGGDITVHAVDTISMSGTLSDGSPVGIFSRALATDSGSGTGGNITLSAGQSVTISTGAAVSASSTGSGNTGNIEIDAGNQFTMTNSSVTTEATQASGGSIKITTNPGGTVQLTDSLISASVLDGTGGGGSVNIDPQYVILLNSQILANAVQGPGGNISITTNFLLPDANSVISASSQFGVNGTITIQSPNAPISGHIQPLGKTPLIATSLLNQHCAAVAGGEFSSFTVAGRDSLPTEPGSWLASPLYAAGVGTGEGLSGLFSLSGVSGVVRGGLAAHQRDQIDQSLLSLRQIAPAGFLTQAFAVEGSSSCQS